MLIWYPRVNNGPSLFLKTGSGTTSESDKIFDLGKEPKDWKAGCCQDYSEYFSMTNLVAASLSIQYIG